MARDYVFFATLGQTDVQVVLTDAEGVARRYPIERSSQRRFHEACRDGRLRWRMRPLAETGGLREDRDLPLEYHPEAGKLSSRLSGRHDRFVDYDCSAGVELCAPLLARAVDRLRSRARLGGALEGVLFTTRREPGDASEPVAAAGLVRDVVARALALPEGEDGGVREVVFLTEPDLYESDQVGQLHLRTSAARRIDEAVAERARRHPSAAAVVEEVGGLPEVKAVLAASCGYRFRDVIFFRPSEREQEDASRGRVLVPPSDSLATRATIARLVRRGSFDAAAALARVAGAAACDHEPWRNWLQEVVAFLESSLTAKTLEKQRRAAPASRTLDQLERLLPGGPALEVGFRVESALQRRSWSWALRETFTFLDLARLELINRRLRRGSMPCLDPTHDVFFPLQARLTRRETAEYLDANHRGKERIRLHMAKPLLRMLTQELPGDAREAFQDLDGALSPLRRYRNVATHGCLEDPLLGRCRRQMWDSGLWSREGECRFLASARVRAVLAALGVGGSPAALYVGLVQAILADLDCFSFLGV